MSNKTIEAILRISAKMGDMKALKTLQNHLTQIDRQAKDINRTQSMMGRLNTNAANATGLLASRMLAPGVLAYGAGRALTDYADLERQLTRTGLKLNGTREEMAALYEDARRAGRSVGLLTGDVLATVDAYSETGASLGDIKSDIKTLTEAQQALGADGRDVVNVWDAARKSFGLMGKDAKRFFGSIGAGGAAGKFEGSDMAQFFPSLLPVAAAAGFKGIEGIDRMVAFAETMRDFTGTSGEAATAMGDFLSKIDSPDVQKNFSKFGIDLEKRLKKARASGQDILSTMREIMLEATKGDATQLTKLFGDKQARDAARVVLQWLEKINEKQNVIEANAPTVIDKNNAELLKDTKTQLDLLWESASRLGTKLGQAIAPGAIPVIEATNSFLDANDAYIKGRQKRGDSKFQAIIAGNVDRMLPWRWDDFDQTAVDGGYNMHNQVLTQIDYPEVAPDFNRPDVPVPMRRPARPGETGYVAPSVPPSRPKGSENTFEAGGLEDRVRAVLAKDLADRAAELEQSRASAGGKIKSWIEEGGSNASDVIRREAIENARAVGFAMKAAFGDAQPAAPAAPSPAPSAPDQPADLVPREERFRTDARKNARDLGFAIDDADVEVRDRPKARSADTTAPAPAASFAGAALDVAQSIAEKFSAARAELLRVVSAREPGFVTPAVPSPAPPAPDQPAELVPREERVRKATRKNALDLGFAIDDADVEVRDRPKARSADTTAPASASFAGAGRDVAQSFVEAFTAARAELKRAAGALAGQAPGGVGAAPAAPEGNGFDAMLRSMNGLAGDLSQGGAAAAQEIIDAAAAIGPAGASGGQQFGDAAALGIAGAASRIRQEILDAGATVAAQIAAALSRGVTVNVSGGGAARLPDPTGNRGRTMPNAGVPGVP